MDYALIGKDLRVKKDVSDLKLYPLFWGRVLGKNYFFASCRTDPSATVPPMRGALSRRLQSQSLFLLGSVFVHGLCSTNLSREPTRHRRLSEGALRSTLPLRLPQPCVSKYAGRCQRSARLAYLRGSGGAPDQKGKKALFRRTNRCRTTKKRLCTRFDHDRSLFESLSLGTLSLHQSRDQTPYPIGPARTDSFLYRDNRWALPRRPRTGCVDGRAGSLLRPGSWLARYVRLSRGQGRAARFVPSTPFLVFSRSKTSVSCNWLFDAQTWIKEYVCYFQRINRRSPGSSARSLPTRQAAH